MPRARQVKRARQFIAELVWERDFDGRFEEREHAIETFERHNEEVRQRVPVLFSIPASNTAAPGAC
jgi:hypothetical protein